MMETSECRSPEPSNGCSGNIDGRSVNELLEKIRSGGLEVIAMFYVYKYVFQIKDVKISEILATYEKKIFLLQVGF